jgi:hypothetical protein
MPAVYTSWKVLPHKPIEKLSPNLWRVQAMMEGGRTQRQMVLAKLGDGRVIVHNAIALSEPDMKELEAWGEPSVIFVPNGWHRMDAVIWKQRYPKANVVAPTGARKRVEKVLQIDGPTESAPSDAKVRLTPLDGVPGEGVMEIHTDTGVNLVFCDAVLNMPKLGFPMSMFLGPTGKISVPRVVRTVGVKDRGALATHLDKLAATPNLERLMFGHGAPITDEPAAALRSVVEQMRA